MLRRKLSLLLAVLTVMSVCILPSTAEADDWCDICKVMDCQTHPVYRYYGEKGVVNLYMCVEMFNEQWTAEYHFDKDADFHHLLNSTPEEFEAAVKERYDYIRNQEKRSMWGYEEDLYRDPLYYFMKYKDYYNGTGDPIYTAKDFPGIELEEVRVLTSSVELVLADKSDEYSEEVAAMLRERMETDEEFGNVFKLVVPQYNYVLVVKTDSDEYAPYYGVIDAINVLKYVAGWDVERRDDFDADHNGKIEIYDAITILKTIANR